MVVGKLRMKNTDSEEVEGKRSKRRKTRSPSIDPPPKPYHHDPIERLPRESTSSSSSYPSRDQKGKSRADEEGDELVFQWTTTSLELANQLLLIPSNQTPREFRMRMREALSAEDGDLRLESMIQNDLYIPRRWQRNDNHNRSRSDLNGHELGQMDSEDYEEYIRKRMWSQSNRKEYIYSKEREERIAEERRRAAEERSRQRLKEKQRAERRALRETRRIEKELSDSRESYYRRWDFINSIINTSSSSITSLDDPQKCSIEQKSRQIVRLGDIPWPVYDLDSGIDKARGGAAGGEESMMIPLDKINLESVRRFLLDHIPEEDNSRRKKTMRTALLSYHPDRFDRLISRVKDSDGLQSTRAKEWGLKVSQVLNDLNQTL